MSSYRALRECGIEQLLGKTILQIDKDQNDEYLIFHTNAGIYRMYHQQDCCETVYLAEVIGDLDDLLNEPIIMASKETEPGNEKYDSSTWTFYKLATIKGSVTLRWLGKSNGYYSESVNFVLFE